VNTTLTARPVSSVDINTRVEAVDWASVSTHLDGYGWAMAKTTKSSCGATKTIGQYVRGVDAKRAPLSLERAI